MNNSVFQPAYRTSNASETAPLEAIRDYFASDVDGPGLNQDFLNECKEGTLRKMAFLAGELFERWMISNPPPSQQE